MNDGPTPLPRRKLSDEVKQRLLEFIRQEALQPGDTIPSERALMAQFDVGRPVVREAMQSLQSMGLITIRHGERPRIAQPSFSNILGHFAQTMHHTLRHSETSLENLKEARGMFEIHMARLAADKATPEQIEGLEAALAAQEAAREDPETFLKCDGRFHAVIAEMSGNPIFSALSASIFGWLADFHIAAVRAPKLEQLTLDEHRLILAAIAAGDPEDSARQMEDHLNRANDLYRRDGAQTS